MNKHGTAALEAAFKDFIEYGIDRYGRQSNRMLGQNDPT
jgi:hypothetical protein